MLIPQLTSLTPRSSRNHYETAIDKNSFDGRYSADSVVVTLSVALALHNALELLLLIFSTFKRYRGLYFFSMVACTTGVLGYATGILLTYFRLGVEWLGKVILDAGWVLMLASQSVVLYSRLNLILDNVAILQAVKWTIVTTSAVLLPIVVVLDFGSTYTDNPSFSEGYYYIEQIQLIVISVQELAISGLYLWKAAALLKIISGPQGRKTIWQLFAINIVIIAMDVSFLLLLPKPATPPSTAPLKVYPHLETSLAKKHGIGIQIVIVSLQFLHYQLYQESLKGFFYSLKLKLELNILSKLVGLVDGNAATNRSNTLQTIEADTVGGESTAHLEPPAPMVVEYPKPNDLQDDEVVVLGEKMTNGVERSRSSGKVGVQGHVTEDCGGSRWQSPLLNDLGGLGGELSSCGKVAEKVDGAEDEDGEDGEEMDEEPGVASLTSQQSTSSRTRGRESDLWYAEMLRDMK